MDHNAELERAREATHDAARPDAVAKQHSRNSLTARERIAALIDSGSFVEIGQLANSVHDGVNAPADGVVTGIGRIGGRTAAILSYDYTVFGGSQGATGHAKLERLYTQARLLECPVVALLEGAGGRVQDLAHFSIDMHDFAYLAKLSGRVPLIAVALGPVFAGHANIAGLCDVIIATRAASLGIAGPPLVAAALGKRLSPEEIGSADKQAAAGVVDILLESDAAALQAVKTYLDFIGERRREFGDEIVSDPECREIVPDNPRRAYDVRRVIERLADVGHVMELRKDFAANIITSFIRIGGVTTGVIANQPMRMAGAINSAAADKAARFIHMCNGLGLPLTFLIDTPGYLVGPEAEAQGLVRHSARMLSALAQFEEPIVSVVLRKAFGMAYGAMGARMFTPVYHVSWPSGEFGGMSKEGATSIMTAKEGAGSGDELATKLNQIGSPLDRAREIAVDDIIDPADTRFNLSRILRMCPSPARRSFVRALDPW
jgi:acetyl-CoA carboxylase carboxyltransferase component